MTAAERITALEARIAAFEARIASLEARPMAPPTWIPPVGHGQSTPWIIPTAVYQMPVAEPGGTIKVKEGESIHGYVSR